MSDAAGGWAGRPGEDALAPFYHRYVSLVPDGDLLETLAVQGAETAALVRSLDGRCDEACAPGKWTVKESVAHVIDTERIFGARALRLGRGDATPLPGYDQDAYVAALDLSGRTATDLADEFERLRAATVDLLASIPHPALDAVGTVSGGPMTARAAAWVIAGHDRHHAAILRERY